MSDPRLTCPVCDTVVPTDTDPIACPKCQTKLTLVPDEDSGGNFYMWLEKTDDEALPS